MWLLPYDNFTILTQYSSEEVYQIINSAIYVSDGYKYQGYDTFATKYFIGNINKSSFQLNQNVIISPKNIVPDIKGEIDAIPNGTKINIKITSARASILLCILLIFLTIAGIEMWHKSTSQRYLPFIMELFGYLIILLPFKVASRQIKATFLDLLNVDVS
jgi:hypothetical protein